MAMLISLTSTAAQWTAGPCAGDIEKGGGMRQETGGHLSDDDEEGGYCANALHVRHHPPERGGLPTLPYLPPPGTGGVPCEEKDEEAYGHADTCHN